MPSACGRLNCSGIVKLAVDVCDLSGVSQIERGPEQLFRTWTERRIVNKIRLIGRNEQSAPDLQALNNNRLKTNV